MRVLVLSVMAVAVATPASAGHGICERLWAERGAIYKDAGLCFKSDKAYRYFGNAGCRYEAVEEIPFRPRERDRLDWIAAEERANGCW